MKNFIKFIILFVLFLAVPSSQAELAKIKPLDGIGREFLNEIRKRANEGLGSDGTEFSPAEILLRYFDALESDWEGTLRKSVLEVDEPLRYLQKTLRFHYAGIDKIEPYDIEGIQKYVAINGLPVSYLAKSGDRSVEHWWDSEALMIKAWLGLYSELGPSKVIRKERALWSVVNLSFIISELAERPELLSRMDRKSFLNMAHSIAAVLRFYPDAEQFSLTEASPYDVGEALGEFNSKCYSVVAASASGVYSKISPDLYLEDVASVLFQCGEFLKRRALLHGASTLSKEKLDAVLISVAQCNRIVLVLKNLCGEGLKL